MSENTIVIYPDHCLTNRADEIKNIDQDILTLADTMEKTLYLAPGVGLAAPQIGSLTRMILVDPSAKKGSGELVVMLNPVIVEKQGMDSDTEMCLSVPDISVEIRRSTRILVHGIDMDGKAMEMEIEGFPARIFQHEIDHLDGRVILDYASRLKRSIYLKKRQKGKI
ncbi:MAG: peptide deformylase [Thermodesulfobacteriota bacterium]|nr:peptide deformylase [Thermodesulfobacteriota bacterium]